MRWIHVAQIEIKHDETPKYAFLHLLYRFHHRSHDESGDISEYGRTRRGKRTHSA